MTTETDGHGDAGPAVPGVTSTSASAGPIHSHFEEWDDLREQYPAFWSERTAGTG